ncbi:hypothetical protein S83_035123, partial [Arachis hypogaea]
FKKLRHLRNTFYQNTISFSDVIRRYHHLFKGVPPTTFQFIINPIQRTLNLLEYKNNQLNFLKKE